MLESDVAIDKIETINGGCRLLAESIGVRTIIKASNQGAADTMAKALTQDKINDALSKSGLPAAKLLDVAAGTMSVVATPEKESFADKVKLEGLGAIIGGAVGGLFSFSLAGLLGTYFKVQLKDDVIEQRRLQRVNMELNAQLQQAKLELKAREDALRQVEEARDELAVQLREAKQTVIGLEGELKRQKGSTPVFAQTASWLPQSH